MAEPPLPRPFHVRALAWVGRRVRPLFDPDHEDRARRLAQLWTRMKALESRLEQNQRAVADVKVAVVEMNAALSKDIGKGREAMLGGQVRIRERVSAVRHAMREQRAIAARILNVSKHAGKLDGTEQWARAHLEKLKHSRGSIIVGPWTGEVGFELLYWAPFVRWVAEEYQLDPGRLTVLSRGGTAAWYGEIASRYVDAFDLVDVDRFRTAATEKLKQRLVGSFDRELLKRARERLGTHRLRVLHPSLMYQLFAPVWKGEATVDRIFAFTRYRLLQAADTALPHGLPASYIAVRFYFSHCFPDTPTNRDLIRSTLQSLTRDHDVVLLDPGLHVDDHHDYNISAQGRIHTLGQQVSPAQNLAVQTAVLARSSGYVGTYGGYAYLAPLVGRDALAFFSKPNFFVHHLEIAHQAFDHAGAGHLTTLDAGTAGLARSALAG